LTIDDTNRKELAQAIIDDLKSLTKGSSSASKCRLGTKGVFLICVLCLHSRHLNPIIDCAQALAALKSLGKNPVGSEVIATSANLAAVLAVSEHLKDDPDASNEALKCIANALLLVESARRTFAKKEVGGGESMVESLEVSRTCIFHSARSLIFSVV
jgi:hypothetical protein